MAGDLKVEFKVEAALKEARYAWRERERCIANIAYSPEAADVRYWTEHRDLATGRYQGIRDLLCWHGVSMSDINDYIDREG